MATGQEATQAGQCSVYMTQGGNRLVVDSSGELDILSGGKIDIESGGALNFASGAYFAAPVQALGVADVATPITSFGLTTIVASTTAPNYTLAAPVAGVPKWVNITSNTSSGTAIVLTNSTGVSVSSTGANKMTLAAQGAVSLVGVSTTKWSIVGVYGTPTLAIRTT